MYRTPCTNKPTHIRYCYSNGCHVKSGDIVTLVDGTRVIVRRSSGGPPLDPNVIVENPLNNEKESFHVSELTPT